MKILESLNWATKFLKQYGVEHSRRNSELLLCHLLRCRPAELYFNHTSLSGPQVNELACLLDKRRKGLPFQYIVGVTEFMGWEFIVNPCVFIPRPETELLVETVLKTVHQSESFCSISDSLPTAISSFAGATRSISPSLFGGGYPSEISSPDVPSGSVSFGFPFARKLDSTFAPRSNAHPEMPPVKSKHTQLIQTGPRTTRSLNILDIGTGCGNIAISLTKHLTHCKIIATDVSGEALRVARRNAQLHKLQGRISFFRGDLFDVFSNMGKRPSFEVIVSNPPYIPSNMLKSLPLEVRQEPKVALDGGEDGLHYYRQIIADASPYLVKDGYLIMEIGFGQLDNVSEIIGASHQFRLAEVIKDYSDIERVVVIQKVEGRN